MNPLQPLYTYNRQFSAPLEMVWQAWITLEELSQWWGPKECTIKGESLEFRPGGFFHYAMCFGDEPPVWGRFNYREIREGSKIEWLNSFANEHCGIARAPFSEVCPLEIRNTATFSVVDGKTLVTLEAQPFGATPEEVAFFAELCETGSLDQGTRGTFDKLESLLAK